MNSGQGSPNSIPDIGDSLVGFDGLLHLDADFNLLSQDSNSLLLEKGLLSPPVTEIAIDSQFHPSLQEATTSICVAQTDLQNVPTVSETPSDSSILQVKPQCKVNGRKKRKRCENLKSKSGHGHLKKKKVKMYEISQPFEDEEEERKRLNAIKAKKDRDERKKKTEELQQKNLELSEELKKQVEDRERIRIKVDQLKDVVKDNERLKFEIGQLKDAMKDNVTLNFENYQLKKKTEELQKEIQDFNKELEVQVKDKETIKIKNEQLKDMIKDNERLKMEIIQLKEMINDNAKLKIESDKLKMKTEELHLDLENLNKQLKNCFEDKEKLRIENTQLKVTVEDSEKLKMENDRLKNIVKDNERLRLENDQLKDMVKENVRLKIENDQLKDMVTVNNRTQASNIKSTKNDCIHKNLNTGCEEGNCHCKSNGEKLIEQCKDIQGLKKDIDIMKNQVNDCQALKNGFESLITQEKDIQKMRDEMHTMKKQIEDYQKMKNEFESLKNQNRDFQYMKDQTNTMKRQTEGFINIKDNFESLRNQENKIPNIYAVTKPTEDLVGFKNQTGQMTNPIGEIRTRIMNASQITRVNFSSRERTDRMHLATITRLRNLIAQTSPSFAEYLTRLIESNRRLEMMDRTYDIEPNEDSLGLKNQTDQIKKPVKEIQTRIINVSQSGRENMIFRQDPNRLSLHGTIDVGNRVRNIHPNLLEYPNRLIESSNIRMQEVPTERGNNHKTSRQETTSGNVVFVHVDEELLEKVESVFTFKNLN